MKGITSSYCHPIASQSNIKNRKEILTLLQPLPLAPTIDIDEFLFLSNDINSSVAQLFSPKTLRSLYIRPSRAEDNLFDLTG